ncbi:hypothetical protein B0H14DRAFT_2632318 [Mycena olivaceomarginata]|nr:hypothetical protein B0H14DRAFT_2632318 [Mycena olivaceomarginata]
MSDITMDWIWSRYTTSPDPAAGMQSLYQMCSAITKHVLLPSHIILSGGGFTLLPELAQILLDAVPLLGQVLNRVMRLSGFPGLDVATQSQVVRSWVNLVDKAYIAMMDIKYLACGRPIHVLGRERPSRMRQIVMLLPPSLRIKLPADFLRSYGILVLLPAANAREVERQHIRYLDYHVRMCTDVSDGAPQQERGNKCDRSYSRSPADHIETGGLASSQLPCRAAHDHAIVAPDNVAPACLRASVSDPSTLMDDLVRAYHHTSTSGWLISSRVARITSKRLLNNTDIVHHRSESSPPYFGLVRLDQPLFSSTEKVVMEMQRLLTAAFAPPMLMGIFRGANCVNELQVAWKALHERLQIAQCRFIEYQRGCEAHTGPHGVPQATHARSPSPPVHPHHHNVSLCTVVGVKIGSIVAVSPLERSLPVVAASAGTTNPLLILGPGTRVSPSIARSQVDAVDTMAAVEYLPTTLPPFTALEPGDLDGNLSDQDKYTACFPTNSSLTASSLSGTTEDAVGHSDHKTRLFRVTLEMSPGDPIPAVKDPPLDSPCELLHVLTGASVAAEGEGRGTDENPRGRQSANECMLEYEQLKSRHGRSGVRVADIVKQFESMTVQFSCAKSSAPSSMTGSFAETELLYTRHRGSPFLTRFKSGMVSASGIHSPLLSTASAVPLSPRLPSVSASATVGGKSSASDIQPQKLTFDPLCISGKPKVEFGGRMEEPTNINSIGCLGYNILAPPPARVLAVGWHGLRHRQHNAKKLYTEPRRAHAPPGDAAQICEGVGCRAGTAACVGKGGGGVWAEQDQFSVAVSLDTVTALTKLNPRSIFRFDAWVEWCQRTSSSCLPLAHSNDNATYETQFGWVQRPAPKNTMWARRQRDEHLGALAKKESANIWPIFGPISGHYLANTTSIGGISADHYLTLIWPILTQYSVYWPNSGCALLYDFDQVFAHLFVFKIGNIYTMATFNKADWVAQGNKYQNIPPHVKRACGTEFQMPAPITSKILPDDSIPLNALLDFTLLRPIVSVKRTSDLSVYFSKSAPDIIDASAILRLRRLDMPPMAVIRRLSSDGRQAWLDGFTSVKYGHINGETVTHFPLWVITYWNTVVDIRTKIRKPWNEARDWVRNQMQQKKRSDVRDLAAETSRLLAILPWNAAKRGLSDTEPLHTLWRYLGPSWMSSTDENDMLHARDAAGANCWRSGPAVELCEKLSTAFKNKEITSYDESSSTRWIRSLGQDIFGRGERLVTIAHLHSPQYEKTLGGYRDGRLRSAFEWWAAKHTSDQLQFDTLPISSQTDGHSCGILAHNAAEHTVFSSSTLIPQADVVVRRLTIFNKISNSILDRIADEEEEMLEPDTNYAAGIEIGTPPGSFQKLARTATFTFQMRAPPQSGSLKRPKSHPDAPTPNASPEKKRTQVIERDRTPPLPFDLWREPPPSSTSLPQNPPPLQSSSPVDVFGGNSTIPSPQKSSSLGSKLLSAQSKIKTFSR